MPEMCAVCQERPVSAGKTTGSARALDLCLQCWGHQKIRRDRAEALGVKLRGFSKRTTNSKRAPARKADPNVPQRYESFEDLVRAITRDDLRRLFGAGDDGK